VTQALARYGARPWQIGLTAAPIAEALSNAKNDAPGEADPGEADTGTGDT